MTQRRIDKVLIANRGEIACRIMRTAKARGVATVAVYSDADRNALHVRSADEAVRIGPAPAAESYLRIDAILGAARASGADAIHPGYGFLSERAAFAEACEKAGIVFVGPPASAIAAMGDKAQSKRRMIAAGVPCIPGYQDEDQSDARLAKEAERIGFPAMLKASAGGGGRGQRIVHDAKDLKEAIASARRESTSAFGDDRLIVEKAVVGARHVEIQVIGDAHGDILHLGERDCSLQRRRQKVIEEAPSPAISAALRAAMGEAAVAAAKAVGYRNAGTVEFLFDPKTEEFYFLEMNTRLQVEHPVTELVTGLDLVALQFDVAEGKPLPFRQSDVALSGAAIEARLYAEDPARDYLPQTGRILRLDWPQGARIDAGVAAGDEVGVFYDPMIAKIIAHGATRDEARRRLIAALKDLRLLGLATNREFLIRLLEDDGFARGVAATDTIEAHAEKFCARPAPLDAKGAAVAAAAFLDAAADDLLFGFHSRGVCAFSLKLAAPDNASIAVAVELRGRALRAHIAGAVAEIEIVSIADGVVRYVAGERHEVAFFARRGRVLDLRVGDRDLQLADLTYAPASDAAGGGDVVKAPMAGLVTSVAVAPGDRIEKGQIVATIEAMKMEHKLVAPRGGVVAEVLAQAGRQTAIRAVLVRLNAATSA